MKIVNSVVVERPKSCYDCPFFYVDSDDGMSCVQGTEMAHFHYDKPKDAYGGYQFERIESPEDALRLGHHECAFIRSTTDD